MNLFADVHKIQDYGHWRFCYFNNSKKTICGQVLSMIGSRHGFKLVSGKNRQRLFDRNECEKKRLKIYIHNVDDSEIISEFCPFDWEEI